MRTISTALAARQNKTITEPGYLVSIAFASGTVHLSSRHAVSILGQTWAARKLAVAGLSPDSDANSSCSLRIGNHDNLMSAFILADGYSGVTVVVYAFWGEVTTEDDLMLLFVGKGSDADSIGAEEVSLKAIIESADNLMTPNTPRIAPPLFNAVLPAGFEIVWGTERYTLRRG